jgi:hypothetical protein
LGRAQPPGVIAPEYRQRTASTRQRAPQCYRGLTNGNNRPRGPSPADAVTMRLQHVAGKILIARQLSQAHVDVGRVD